MRRHHDEDDDGRIVPDGGRVRVPMMMLDAAGHRWPQWILDEMGVTPMAVDALGRPPGHAPGYIFTTTRDAAVQAAWDARSEYLANAWRSQPAAARPAATLAADAARADARTAWEERGRTIRDAWRTAT